MSFLSLFKIYDKKILKRNRMIFLLCLFSMILSVTAVISIQLLNSIYGESIQRKVIERNGGDINIFSENNNFNYEQKLLLENISKDEEIDVELFLRKEVNVFSENKIENAMLYYKNSLEDNLVHGVSIDSILADRLNIKQDDKIQTKIFGKMESFKIDKLKREKEGFSAIGNESEIMEEILGSVDINLSDDKHIGEYNGAFINVKNKNEISKIKNQLTEKLGNDFTVRTEEDLYNSAKNRINFQIQLLNLIGVFAYIICGASMCFTFSVLNIKRAKDIAIFKILGMNKKNIFCLSIVETIFVVLITFVVAIPIGVFAYSYLTKIFLGGNIKIDFFLFKEVMRIILFILGGMFVFAIIPIDIISNIPIIKIFRNRKVNIGEDIKTYRSFIAVFVIASLISCLIIKSFYGIILSFAIMTLIVGFVMILSFIYWLVSKANILFKTIYYIAFKELGFNKNYNALISASFILGISLILIFLNLNNNLLDSKALDSSRVGNIVLNVDINEENKIENIIPKREKKQIEKYYINNVELISINGEKINTIIDNRFTSSEELREDYYNYVKSVKLSEVDSEYKNSIYMQDLKTDKNNERKIVISTDFFNMIHEFKVNDEIVFKIGENNVKYSVCKVLDKSQSKNQDTFAFVLHEDSKNIKDIIYKLNEDKKLYTILKDVPSAYSYDTLNMNSYTERLINKYRGIFIYSTMLIIISGMFFMINGSCVSIKRRMKNISIYYAMGATVKGIRYIYILESVIYAIINSLIAILISDFISRFIIEVMAQKTYLFSMLTNILVIIISIMINIIIYWEAIKKFNRSDINYLLRGEE